MERPTANGAVAVRLDAGDEASGLASMIGQYLEQILTVSPQKCAEAATLRGRFGLNAREGDVAVTVEFGDRGIDISEGLRDPDAVISGPVETLMHTLAGRANPALEVCRGAITVVPGAEPLFGYRAYRLMRLPGVHVWSGVPRPPTRLLVGIAVAVGAGVIVWQVRRSRVEDDHV